MSEKCKTCTRNGVDDPGCLLKCFDGQLTHWKGHRLKEPEAVCGDCVLYYPKKERKCLMSIQRMVDESTPRCAYYFTPRTCGNCEWHGVIGDVGTQQGLRGECSLFPGHYTGSRVTPDYESHEGHCHWKPIVPICEECGGTKKVCRHCGSPKTKCDVVKRYEGAESIPCPKCQKEEKELMVSRSELKRFVAEMEEVLEANDHKSHWSDEGSDYLKKKLDEEVAELREALENYVISEKRKDILRSKLEAIQKEAIDVANIAMMIWDNTNSMGKEWL